MQESHTSFSNTADKSKMKRAFMEQTRKDKDRLYRSLRALDPECTQKISFTVFKQAAKDNDIELEQRSLSYILKTRCDSTGNINYLKLIKDLVLRNIIDITGKQVYRWHVK